VDTYKVNKYMRVQVVRVAAGLRIWRPGASQGAVLRTTKAGATSARLSTSCDQRARLVATGTAGHGSVPRLDNPLIHLDAAVQKAGQWETPMRLNETRRTYLGKMATISTPERAAAYKALLDPKLAGVAHTTNCT
jgi:hypothetical protein